VATDNAWGRFRQWRRHRPFWGGLFLILAGLELFFSANLTLADMEVHFGQEGYLSYLLPIILLICGALVWVTPAQRLFYGIIGLVTALYSFLGLNLGGFGIGMLIGIVGGALVIAWGPPRIAPTPATAEADAEPASSPSPSPSPSPSSEPDDAEDERDIAIAGSDLPPRAPYSSDPPTEILPGFGEEGPPRTAKDRSVHRKAFVITLVPLLVSAVVLVSGGHSPARAAECPDGSRSAAEAKKEAARQSAPTKKTAAIAKPRSSSKAPAKAKAPDEKDKADPDGKAAPSASPSPSEDGSGNPIVDGWNEFVDGVKDLVGVGDEPTPSPTPAEPSPSTPEPTPTGTPGPADPTVPGVPVPSGSPIPSGSASPSPTPNKSDVPCLGPRVFKVAGPDDVPRVSIKGGLLEADKLTMYDSTYDGTIDLETANGTIKALKFSMDKAVNDAFSLTIPEAGGHTTLIKSKQLITDKNVKFYTPNFQGKLFGLIPVTFTPESPPPLTLPVLWFTDVKINLAFVRCDTLTAKPIAITEK
jgi:uncharacterized protein DUF6114